MSGKIIRALPLTVFDIGSAVAHGEILTINAGRVIDVSQYREATLVVRLHSSFGLASLTPSWEVKALISGFTDEDSKAQFVGATVADTGAQTTNSAPAVLPVQFSTPFGPEVVIQVILSQFNSTVLVCHVALSVDIVAKC